MMKVFTSAVSMGFVDFQAFETEASVNFNAGPMFFGRESRNGDKTYPENNYS